MMKPSRGSPTHAGVAYLAAIEQQVAVCSVLPYKQINSPFHTALLRTAVIYIMNLPQCEKLQLLG